MVASCIPCDIGSHEGCRGKGCGCGCSSSEGQRLADEGIARAAAHAEEWVAEVVRYVRSLPAGTAFTTDRLWWAIERFDPMVARPLDRRAMGAAVRACEQDGLISRDTSGRVHRSTRPDCHGRPLTIWLRRGAVEPEAGSACGCPEDDRPEPVAVALGALHVLRCPECRGIRQAAGNPGKS